MKLRWLRLPLIRHWPMRRQLSVLFPTLVLALLAAWAVVWFEAQRSMSLSVHTRLVGDALMHSQRLARNAPAASRGQSVALTQFAESRESIASALQFLREGGELGDHSISALPSDLLDQLKTVEELWQRTDRAALALLSQKGVLGGVVGSLDLLSSELPALADRSEQVSQLLAAGSQGVEALAAARLFASSERMAREVLQLAQPGGSIAERAMALRSDAAAYGAALDALIGLLQSRRSPLPRDVEALSRLQQMRTSFGQLSPALSRLIESLPGLKGGAIAHAAVMLDNESLKTELLKLRAQLLEAQAGLMPLRVLAGALLLLAVLSGIGLGLAVIQDLGRRAEEAEAQRRLAEQLEQQAKQTNEMNQAAILRLMNELQEVADGDLTVQATVSEEITGAIADSVNYTIEELRNLVSRINATSGQVNEASSQAQTLSARLQAVTERQASEIRQTGQAVLGMATRIREVSSQASESAEVARAALEAAALGREAVAKSMAGMNDIRDHIQETSKRIKRLGESSQEIGEIVALITDLTEQTNVLALNAAIQAASAGEAGRGFSTVAEEVQRLAERSVRATRQITSLIRGIQLDTQDAVAAMERSTQGVVAGTALSDDAGQALEQIDAVSRELADLIARMADVTGTEASTANAVARSIGKILQYTDHAREGSQSTAVSVQKLNALARELQTSVSRFRVSPS
ncbi:MAG: methyl-accepting chemotaxis protein [Burkholderiaceae bacterium]